VKVSCSDIEDFNSLFVREVFVVFFATFPVFDILWRTNKFVVIIIDFGNNELRRQEWNGSSSNSWCLSANDG
jgi:hypothetical protein